MNVSRRRNGVVEREKEWERTVRVSNITPNDDNNHGHIEYETQNSYQLKIHKTCTMRL